MSELAIKVNKTWMFICPLRCRVSDIFVFHFSVIIFFCDTVFAPIYVQRSVRTGAQNCVHMY